MAPKLAELQCLAVVDRRRFECSPVAPLPMSVLGGMQASETLHAGYADWDSCFRSAYLASLLRDALFRWGAENRWRRVQGPAVGPLGVVSFEGRMLRRSALERL